MFNLFLQKSVFAAFILTIPLLFNQQILAQTITGRVLDAQTKEPLQGAAIRQQGTTRGVVSQNDGSFTLKLSSSGKEALRITFLGFQEKEVDVSREKSDLRIYLYPETYIGDDIFVRATRVDESSPITYTNIDREDIEERNLGQDLPYLLQSTPSVTTTSDAGAGVGYTGIRIRGVDPARINVTINGIPANDAESHGLFWVDLPDLASSIENIQIQRGVGTSTNGAGAFGATINLQTSSSSPEPFGEINTGFGSFNTQKYNVKLGSGLMKNGWQFEGRLSNISSDGYIDRAAADLNSYFLSASHHGERSLLRADVFSGKEVTYQAWDGVPESMLSSNRTYNESGTEKSGDPYDNQVDDFQQNYYQLHYSYQLQSNWNANISAFYTKGFGYYEEYKAQQSLADYSIQPILPSTPTSSDLIRRRWLDNDFYGAIFSTKYTHSNTWNVIIGGGYNYYKGGHFGEVIWSRYAENNELGDRYYDNDGIKKDGNAYAKLQYKITENVNTYLDLQVRGMRYEFLGNDVIRVGNPPAQHDSSITLQQEDDLFFFNPKAGFVYQISQTQRGYASFGVGGKEPTRDEYVNSTKESRPSPEKLYNVEVGYRGDFTRYYIGGNFYGMFYKDQLVPTGAINDVGEIVRQNVPNSYRMGLELQGGVSLSDYLSWALNATFSQNKIVEYTQFTDVYANDFTPLGQQATTYENTDIAFSPSVIANSVLGFNKNGLNAELISRYVSRQYLDNTQTNSRSINPYFVNDIRLSYSLDKIPLLKGITATLQVSNILNYEYESNGYTYGWLRGGAEEYYNYYFPQAGTNFLFQVKWKF